MVNILFMWSVI